MFFKKKRNNKQRGNIELYDPKKIYVLTTEIYSDFYDENEFGIGPKCITQFFLATKENEKFYELFSKVEIEYEDNSVPGIIVSKFNEPMIKEVESLRKYVVNPHTKLTSTELFYFLNMLNAKPKVLGSHGK